MLDAGGGWWCWWCQPGPDVTLKARLTLGNSRLLLPLKSEDYPACWGAQGGDERSDPDEELHHSVITFKIEEKKNCRNSCKHKSFSVDTAPQRRFNQILFYWSIIFFFFYPNHPQNLHNMSSLLSLGSLKDSWDYTRRGVVFLKGGRTILDAWESRLIPSERRCRVKRWQIGSPRRSTAWRDPRCPERCARPPHTSRQLQRKSTWNVSHRSISRPIHLVLLTLILPCTDRPSWCLHAPVWASLALLDKLQPDICLPFFFFKLKLSTNGCFVQRIKDKLWNRS